MSANQHEKLISETAKERTARLQQMSANQHKRLVSETAEQREARLQSFEGPTGVCDCRGEDDKAAADEC